MEKIELYIEEWSDVAELLDKFQEFLMFNDYLDNDCIKEEPFAIDSFMKENYVII